MVQNTNLPTALTQWAFCSVIFLKYSTFFFLLRFSVFHWITWHIHHLGWSFRWSVECTGEALCLNIHPCSVFSGVSSSSRNSPRSQGNFQSWKQTWAGYFNMTNQRSVWQRPLVCPHLLLGVVLLHQHPDVLLQLSDLRGLLSQTLPHRLHLHLGLVQPPHRSATCHSRCRSSSRRSSSAKNSAQTHFSS